MAKRKQHWQVKSNKPKQQQQEIKSLDSIIKNSDTANLLALKKVIDIELESRLNEVEG
jgi:hypothetical protein